MFGSVWDCLLLIWDNFSLTHLPPTSQQTISPFPEIMIGKNLRLPYCFVIFQLRELILRLNTASPCTSLGFEPQELRGKLPIDLREGQAPLTRSKIGQNLDFPNVGQRRLGTPGMVRVDIKVVSIGPLSCLEVSGTVYC